MLRIAPLALLLTLALWQSASAQPSPDRTTAPAFDTSRIVTIGGAVTEIVHALGLGDRVVATDRSSTFPKSVQRRPRLSYFRESSAEGILSARPSLVLATRDMGPPAVADQVRSAGVDVLMLDEATTPQAAAARIRIIARALDRREQGEVLVRRMQTELSAAQAMRPAKAPRVLFVYARGASTLLVAGDGTSAQAVVELAGGVNALSGFDGFRPLTAEAVVTAAPDVIVLPEGGLESIGGVDGLLRLPGLALTPAAQSRRVVTVDDALLLSFGPRLGEGVRALAQALSNAPAN